MKDVVKGLSQRALRLVNVITPPAKSPDDALGELFHDVQVKGINMDGMTFVDSVPKKNRRRLLLNYKKASRKPDFNLETFVETNFIQDTDLSSATLGSVNKVEGYINDLWPLLVREAPNNEGSIMALPHPYVVPGGRFQCQFYWDSYFTMIGLTACGHWDLVENIYKNASFMILKFGFIPTANRTYYVSRSQPPFYSQMVELIAEKRGQRRTYITALPYLLKEYQFWMNGLIRPRKPFHSYRRIVTLPEGVLNRYFDAKNTPRPESYREDTETAIKARTRDSRRVYRDLRAGAESGWDFSSRWFADPLKLDTIHTLDIIPVDLNCLLYMHEMSIAKSYTLLKQPLLAKIYRKKAKNRAELLMQYCWNEEKKFFFDYDFVAKEQTQTSSLAGSFPLYAGLVDAKIAAKVVEKLESEFLKQGGFVTTLHESGQQWDAPIGWAPLQWIVIEGLKRYGYHDLANQAADRWINLNVSEFNKYHKLFEKYDVVNLESGSGGEYPVQDGFGWTNAVLIKLIKQKRESA
jgi:alpha,alpha-trehalase